MKRTISLIGAIAIVLASPLYADYGVESRGSWPKTWPKELEPLRKQARTLEGPLRPLLHFAIPFTKREEFESAWPHILKVKSEGAPLVLRRGPSFWLEGGGTAGVCIHAPPQGQASRANYQSDRLQDSIYIELIVDGSIVDLNRIPLPTDTPIIDKRFKADKK